MKTHSKLRLMIAALALTPAVLWAQSHAPIDTKNYPQRPVRFVVPFAAGGGTDIVARKIGNELSASLGQPVIIENRPGGSSAIGINAVVAAPADGYTLLVTHSSPIIQNPLIFKKLSYDPKKDLTPVVEISRGQQVLLVNASLPINDLKEFIAYAKSRGADMSFGSWGAGTVSHFAGDYLGKIIGTQMIHVPYQGTAPAMQALMGNQVGAVFIDPATAKPQVVAGKLRAIAVAGANRSPALPDVPTFKELGMSEMVPFGGWIGILAPAGTPPEIVARISEKTMQVIKREDVFAWLNERGYVPSPAPAAELSTAIQNESTQWKQIFESIGVEKQ